MSMEKRTGGIDAARKSQAERRQAELRIQALGAAISRRDWHATEQAYNAIRDKFDAEKERPWPTP